MTDHDNQPDRCPFLFADARVHDQVPPADPRRGDRRGQRRPRRDRLRHAERGDGRGVVSRGGGAGHVPDLPRGGGQPRLLCALQDHHEADAPAHEPPRESGVVRSADSPQGEDAWRDLPVLMFVAASICSMGWEGLATCTAQGEGESAASLHILPAWVFDTAILS
jgi:hypothetical protein